MRKLPATVIEKISDFEAESPLSLRGYAIEKDFFVVETIALIKALPIDPDFRFVFCGGTCLAKAHGILDRMSEDIDFKVVPSDSVAGLGTAALRRKLNAFVTKVMAWLEEGEGGFGKGSVSRRSLDDNRYTSLDETYQSAFGKPASLRAHLLIELNYTTPSSPTEMHAVGQLLDKLTTGAYQHKIDIECVSIQQALAEKLVSFPRRLSLQLQKNSEDQTVELTDAWDKAMVRHLFDVYQIIQSCPVVLADVPALGRNVSSTIAHDAIEFAAQHPQFCTAPLAQLQDALAWAASSSVLHAQYDLFVADMVYGPPAKTPSYDQALGTFTKTLLAALATTNPADILRGIEAALDSKKKKQRQWHPICATRFNQINRYFP